MTRSQDRLHESFTIEPDGIKCACGWESGGFDTIDQAMLQLVIEMHQSQARFLRSVDLAAVDWLP